MRTTGLAVLLAACVPCSMLAQPQASEPGPAEKPEEVIVIGYRGLLKLRVEMLDAERTAYDGVK